MAAWTLVFLLAALQAVTALPVTTKQTKDTSYRLPENTPTPVSYVVSLTPNLNESKFTGNLVLTIIPKVVTNTVVLHSKNITVGSIKVNAQGDSVDLYLGYAEDTDRDFLTITLNTNMALSTNYIITIDYEGILHDDMYGFYKSTYTDDDGEQRVIAATQFQPTHARKAFPCFDEPKYKATFKISINTPAGYHSLCNTPLENSPTPGGAALYSFKETPKMSTYLIAFVVSDFANKTVTANDIEFKTWARSNAIEAGGQYSIDVTPSILHELEEYTDIPYNRSGLFKVDQVALPDFSAGAMENWGLVTYRERALLWTQGVSTAANRQSIASIISHELAHMWFGNLITTDWWDTTWLNEGFATYFENYITSKVEPDFRIMDQFVVSVHQGSMGTDALPASHPLSHVCYTPAEVSAMFSTITYSKGGSILRMLNHSITEERFQAALSSYLKEREFNTAVPSQLMTHLTAQATPILPSDVSYTDVVKSWTEQAGFPVVKVERKYEDKTATVSQSRFLLTTGTEDATLYHVPLNWASEGDDFRNTTPKTWLTGKSMEISDLPDDEKWVVFNIQETGYYRVHYDDKNWRLLVQVLNNDPTKIHFLNRAQLIDDAFNLARIGQLPYSIALGVAESLANEEDYVPWLAGLNGFSFVNRRVMGHDEYPLFKTFLLRLLSNVYSKLGFADEGEHVDKLHRSSILSWACNMGNEACLQSAATKLKAYVDSNAATPIEPNLQSVVYCYGLKNSDNATWDFLWQRYQTSNDQFEQTLLLQNLGCTNDKEILERYLQYSIDENSGIRRQDASAAFSAVYGNPEGLEIAIKFLGENFDKIVTYYGSMNSIGNIVRGVAAQVTNEEQKAQFATFLATNAEALGSAKDAAEQTVDENLAWSASYQTEIFNVLRGPDEVGDSGMILTPGLTTFFLTLILCIKFIV